MKRLSSRRLALSLRNPSRKTCPRRMPESSSAVAHTATRSRDDAPSQLSITIKEVFQVKLLLFLLVVRLEHVILG